MKKKYYQTNSLTNILFLITLFALSNRIYSQCLTAPADLTINCGDSTTLSATSTALSYSLVTSSCAPIAITGTNAFPVNCDDCVTGQIPIGFPFNFYGNTYTTGVITSNGIIGFGPAFSYTGYSTFAIPASGNPNNYIAGFFADIDIRYGGIITYQTIGVAPNRKFIVSYDNVVPFNLGNSAGTGTASFQIVLNETGSFQVIVSQLSADWFASTSGAFATSGAENNTGTYAFPVPGRNASDWPGIIPGNLDCNVFSPQSCDFQRWQQGGTIVSLTPSLTISPNTTTPYTAYWNCGGSLCFDDTVVNVKTPSFSYDANTSNTNCSSPNGTISFTAQNLSGTHNLAYDVNGSPISQTVSLVGSTNITQGELFNIGVLSTTDPTWNRNLQGASCNATAGSTHYYDVFAFKVSSNGSYTLNMCTPGVNFDAFASLYQNGFNGATPCAISGDFIFADDDSNVGGNCENDPTITANLLAGITYYLVSTSYNPSVVGNYSWTFTGPPSATIIFGDPKVTVSNLSSGTYTNFQLNVTNCGVLTIPGPFTVLDTSTKTWSGVTNTQWSEPTNWSGGVIPNSADCVVIPNEINDPIVSGVAYEALVGTLTIQNGGNLTINPNNYITVTNGITVNTGGIFTFENDASLLQTNNAVNTGNITYKRNASNIRGLDYIYWSSPVANQNISSIYTSPAQGPKFTWNTSGTNTNGGLGRWDAFSGNMIKGKGYILRGSSTYGMVATTINTTFIGNPNNGNLTIKAFRGDMTTATVPSSYSAPMLNVMNDNWNLLGNPYPSAINGLEFLSTNNANLLGNLRLWRHLNEPTVITSPFYQNFNYNYNSNDYLTINFTGPTAPGASDIIKSGQAFMVQRIEGTQDLIGADIQFTNNMRRNAGAIIPNNNFFKTTSIVSNNTSNKAIEKHRIWLDIVDNTTNLSETTLIGYVDGATINFDSNYDAGVGISKNIGIYTFVNGEKCIIQGRPIPFNQEDVVPVGINVHTNGNYSIAIKAVDGIFKESNQTIYLEDHLLNVIHSLSESQYSFTENKGTINDRFILRYNNVQENNEFEDLSNEIKIFTNNNVNITSSNSAIENIIIYNGLGKILLKKSDISKQELVLTELRPINNMIIVKVTLNNKKVVIKKVIF